MKGLKLIRYGFPLIGVALLAGGMLVYQSRTTFLAEAVRAEGVVVDLERHRSSDSTTYRPVVRFATGGGEEIEFVSSSGSSPPSYSRGERVQVLYLPSRPHDAEIDGFFALWGAASILGGMGMVFLLIGAAIIVLTMLRARREEYLRRHGVSIDTEFQGVEQNESLTVNGRHPYRVLTQWQHPATGAVHVFLSNNLWFDPTRYITAKRIKVFIEKNNPEKYFVDLSFLPKAAD